MFVVLRDKGVLTSGDGETWEILQPLPFSTMINIYFKSVIFAHGRFVIVGLKLGYEYNINEGFISLFSKANGLSWPVYYTEIYTGKVLNSVAFGNNQCLTVGTLGAILSSLDDSLWTRRNQNLDKFLNSVAFGNGRFVTVGSSNCVRISDDLKNWQVKDISPTDPGHSVTFHSVVYCNNQFFILDIRYVSPDGNSWEYSPGPIMDVLFSMTYGKSQFVAVGYSSSSGKISTSLDGTTWTDRTSGTSSALRSVTFGDSQFVTVGDRGTILTSSDATAWTPQGAPANNLYGVAYGNNIFIAVGDSGAILTSPNGIAWMSRNSLTTAPLYGVIWADSQFVAVGGSGTILTSSDGLKWTVQNSGTIINILSITYGSGQFVAVGGTNNGTGYLHSGFGSLILTSMGNIPVSIKQNASNLTKNNKIKCTISIKNISVKLPNDISKNLSKVELFTITGRKFYSASTKTNNGTLNIPSSGFSSGKYFITITYADNKSLTSTFVLTR
jgi:hypothetical protein